MQSFQSFLRATGISKSYRGVRVLTDISFVLHSGARAGLIGQNGAGKSTLLRILAGVDHPDRGAVEVSQGARVGLLRQDFSLPFEATVGQTTEEAQRELRQMLTQIESLSAALAEDPQAGDDLADALARADAAGAWNLEPTRDETLAGLGLGTVDRDRRVGTLSGGQRSRLMLACLLLSRPAVLLLDEPTNHLDDAATDFLKRTLLGWQGPVLTASHDRAFLDDIATETLDLDQVPGAVSDQEGGLVRTRGRYSDYVLARLDERESWERQYAVERGELKRLRSRVRSDQKVGRPERGPKTEGRAAKKFYSDRNAKVVKRRVDDAERKLVVLQETQVRKPPRELVFSGLIAAGTPPEAATVSARDLAVAGRLEPVTVDLRAGQKLLIVGANGSGKSTLLALVAGRLKPTGGTMNVNGRVGLLAQDPQFDDLAATSEKTFESAVGQQRCEERPLSSFGLLHPRDLGRPIGELSTGQLRRLDLAIVLANPPAILALDEPTNHLSLELATAIESLLPDYPGMVLVASHDRWLRRQWKGRVLRLGHAL